MRALALLLLGLLGSDNITDYSRSLASKELDQPTLDAEGYGEKKAFKREADGLRITLAPGEQETGWKTPPQVTVRRRFHDFRQLRDQEAPQARPGRRSGHRCGDRVSRSQSARRDPGARLLEPNGADVYRSIEKAGGNPMQMQMQMQMQMNMRMMMMGRTARRQAPQAAAAYVSGRGRHGPHGARARRVRRFDYQVSTPSRHSRAISARPSSVPTT